MLDVRIYDCEDCYDIKTTLDSLDNRISFLSERLYNSKVYLSPVSTSLREIKNLLYYKNILLHLFWNGDYYSYDFKKIISKIKSLL